MPDNDDLNPVMMAAAAGAQAVGGIVNTVRGIFGNAKANKMDRQNIRPDYEIQEGIKDNQAIAEHRASEGLNDGTLAVVEQENERGLSASLDAISKNGGNANNIAQLYGNYSTGVNKLALIDEQMRAANIRALIEQNERMSEEQDKEWQINVYNPWADKAQAAAQLRKQSAENISNGINSIVGAGTNYAASQTYKKEGDGVYGTRSASGPRFVESGNPVRVNNYNQGTTVPAGAAAGIASRWPGLTGGYGTIGPANYP